MVATIPLEIVFPFASSSVSLLKQFEFHLPLVCFVLHGISRFVLRAQTLQEQGLQRPKLEHF